MSTLETPILLSPGTLPRMAEDEYVAWTRGDSHSEWVAGEVLIKMPIDEVHDALQSAIKESVRALVRRSSLGQVRGEKFTMRLPQKPSRRDPDVMFVASENLDRLTRTLLEGPCDLAVEIVSEDSVARDYRVKFAEYEAAGVREYWIVDPIVKTIEAHKLNAGKYEPIQADAEGRLHSSVLPGWWLRGEELFCVPSPTALDLMRSLGVI